MCKSLRIERKAEHLTEEGEHLKEVCNHLTEEADHLKEVGDHLTEEANHLLAKPSGSNAKAFAKKKMPCTIIINVVF